MPWVFLDDKFHSNPKVLAAGNAGAGLYARALSYCGDHLTDGFVPEHWAKAAASPKLREKLVHIGIWTVVPGGYQIPDYLKLNPSKEKVLAKRAERSKAGSKGAANRWNKDGNSHSNSNGTSHDDRIGLPSHAACTPTPTPVRSNERTTAVDMSVFDFNDEQKAGLAQADPQLVEAWCAVAMNPPASIQKPAAWMYSNVMRGAWPEGHKKPVAPDARFESLRSFVARFGSEYPNMWDLAAELRQRGADELMVQRLLKEAS